MLKKHNLVILLLGVLLYSYSGAAPLASGAAKFVGKKRPADGKAPCPGLFYQVQAVIAVDAPG